MMRLEDTWVKFSSSVASVTGGTRTGTTWRGAQPNTRVITRQSMASMIQIVVVMNPESYF